MRTDRERRSRKFGRREQSRAFGRRESEIFRNNGCLVTRIVEIGIANRE
jgi:hypothetical protein